jgi:hypothetical protein
LHDNESAADYLESLASKLRERPEAQPSGLVIFGVRREDDTQMVEFWAGPRTPSALEFLGIVEMGKATFISSSGG